MARRLTVEEARQKVIDKINLLADPESANIEKYMIKYACFNDILGTDEFEREYNEISRALFGDWGELYEIEDEDEEELEEEEETKAEELEAEVEAEVEAEAEPETEMEVEAEPVVREEETRIVVVENTAVVAVEEVEDVATVEGIVTVEEAEDKEYLPVEPFMLFLGQVACSIGIIIALLLVNGCKAGKAIATNAPVAWRRARAGVSAAWDWLKPAMTGAAIVMYASACVLSMLLVKGAKMGVEAVANGWALRRELIAEWKGTEE